MRGLTQFEIENFDLRILRGSVTFQILFQQLTIDGQHSTRASLAGIPIAGNGSIVMAFNDVRVNGSLVFNTINQGYLNVRSLRLGVNVGSVAATLRGFGIFLDPTISLAISLALPGIINNGQETINELVDEQLLPTLNEVLNQNRLLDLIVAIINAVLNPNTDEISLEKSENFPPETFPVKFDA